MSTFDRIGYNLRLSDIQAAVGIAQMAKLDGLLSERRRLAAGYRERLSNRNDIVLPAFDPGHSYQSFVIRVADGGRNRRNALMAALGAADIQTRPGTHAVPALGFYRQQIQSRSAAIPQCHNCGRYFDYFAPFPGMTAADIDCVVEVLGNALAAT